MFVYTTDGGYVNLAFVARAVRSRDGASLLLYGADGTILGRHDGDLDIQSAGAAIVPASSAVSAIVIGVLGDKGRPTEDDVYVEEHPIVAWRVTDGDAPEPVLIERVFSHETILILLPGGALLRQLDRQFPSLDEAKASLLADEQRRWDSQQ